MNDSFLPATTWPPDTNLVASPARRQQTPRLRQQGAVFDQSLTHLWWGWPRTHLGRHRPQTEYRWAQRGSPVASHSCTLLLWILTKKEKLYLISEKDYRLQQVTCSVAALLRQRFMSKLWQSSNRLRQEWRKPTTVSRENQTKWLQTNVQKKIQSKTQETFHQIKYKIVNKTNKMIKSTKPNKIKTFICFFLTTGQFSKSRHCIKSSTDQLHNLPVSCSRE